MNSCPHFCFDTFLTVHTKMFGINKNCMLQHKLNSGHLLYTHLFWTYTLTWYVCFCFDPFSTTFSNWRVFDNPQCISVDRRAKCMRFKQIKIDGALVFKSPWEQKLGTRGWWASFACKHNKWLQSDPFGRMIC